MPEIERVQPAALPSTGGGFTHVVRIGPWVFISGQTAGGMDGAVVGGDDALAQGRHVFQRLGLAMESVGGTFADIVKTTTFITNASDFEKVRQARAEAINNTPPTSASITISHLARPGIGPVRELLLEVEAVGYLRTRAVEEDTVAEVQHLQPKGMSPNGNRYTHVVKVGPWVYIAGQTATDESGNVVGVGDPAAQVDQVFKNLTVAIESVGGKLTDIFKTTVYVVGEQNSEPIRVARAGRFGDKPPASTLLIIAGLARPEFMLEIEAIGYVE